MPCKGSIGPIMGPWGARVVAVAAAAAAAAAVVVVFGVVVVAIVSTSVCECTTLTVHEQLYTIGGFENDKLVDSVKGFTVERDVGRPICKLNGGHIRRSVVNAVLMMPIATAFNP